MKLCVQSLTWYTRWAYYEDFFLKIWARLSFTHYPHALNCPKNIFFFLKHFFPHLKNFLKGYISFEKKMVVTAKGCPFPSISSAINTYQEWTAINLEKYNLEIYLFYKFMKTYHEEEKCICEIQKKETCIWKCMQGCIDVCLFYHFNHVLYYMKHVLSLFLTPLTKSLALM